MKLSFPQLIFALMTLASPAIAERAELPSDGLQSRIDFWKKVYTQYGEDDVIIHDRIRVNLIYDVATRDEKESKIAAVRQALQEIRNGLDAPQNLSPTALQIRDAIVADGVPLTADSLADLLDNVQTQLGIKERFREGIIRSGRYVEAYQDVIDQEGHPVAG